MCVVVINGPQMGRIRAEKQEFRDVLEKTMGMVELEVMLCILGNFIMHVGVLSRVKKNVLVNLVGERGIESVESLWSWEQGMGWP